MATWRLRDNPDSRACALCHDLAGVGMWSDARAAWVCIACAGGIARDYPAIAVVVGQQARDGLQERHDREEESR